MAGIGGGHSKRRRKMVQEPTRSTEVPARSPAHGSRTRWWLVEAVLMFVAVVIYPLALRITGVSLPVPVTYGIGVLIAVGAIPVLVFFTYFPEPRRRDRATKNAEEGARGLMTAAGAMIAFVLFLAVLSSAGAVTAALMVPLLAALFIVFWRIRQSYE